MLTKWSEMQRGPERQILSVLTGSIFYTLMPLLDTIFLTEVKTDRTFTYQLIERFKHVWASLNRLKWNVWFQKGDITTPGKSSLGYRTIIALTVRKTAHVIRTFCFIQNTLGNLVFHSEDLLNLILLFYKLHPHIDIDTEQNRPEIINNQELVKTM